MKYLKKLSLNEDNEDIKLLDNLYSTYLNREKLYNIIIDLIPDILLLDEYNHSWVQNKKENNGYFYFLTFKNPMYSKIKNTFKSDLYRLNQIMSEKFDISYILSFRANWWMDKDVKLTTKSFDNFKLLNDFLSTLNNNDVISELLIIFDNLELNENNKIDIEKDLSDELSDIMTDLLDTDTIQRKNLKNLKTINQYCYEIIFKYDTKISDVLDEFKSSVYTASGIMDGRYEISYAVSLSLIDGRKTYHRQSFFHTKQLFNYLERKKSIFIDSFDFKMNY